MVRRRLLKRPLFWLILGAVAAFVVFIGPWPTLPNGPYETTDYAKVTFERLDALPIKHSTGNLLAGVAAVDITPPVGEPMAGFGARRPKESAGIADRLEAVAISLRTGEKTVTILGGDILLPLPELRNEILRRTNLPPEDVYFTATHTHSGPGGYSPQFIHKFVMGNYDEKILHRMADAFGQAIMASRANMQPAEITISQGHDKGIAVNRLDRSAEAHNTVSAILLTSGSKNLACMIVASPHATCYSKGNRLVSGDYPTVVREIIRARYDCPCLFAAGAVGSTGPDESAPKGLQRALRLGGRIAVCAADILEDVAESAGNNPDIATAVLEIDLPPRQFRLTGHMMLSPFATAGLHSRKTYIHMLRIGDAVLIGMPADFSGELAAELESWAAARGLTVIITSFNGDYIGYVLPYRRYSDNSYEARTMNFFGPFCGEYLSELAKRLIRKS